MVLWLKDKGYRTTSGRQRTRQRVRFCARSGTCPVRPSTGLAEAFDTHQELISRWLSYRRHADWRRLTSRRHGPLLSTCPVRTVQGLDQIQQIVNVWAPQFWWTVEEVQAYLAKQGIEYSRSQIEEAGRLSGFLQVRRRLRERFHLGPEAVKPRDDWLVQRLFDQVSTLLSKVEAGEGTCPVPFVLGPKDQGRQVQGLTPEERLGIGTLQAQREALGFSKGTELEKPLPWLYQVQHVLFGW